VSFSSVVWFKLHINTGSLDFLLYYLKHLKWENIYNTYTRQTVIIVMLSILRWKTMCNSTLEINLVYPWLPLSYTRCKQVLMWISLTFCEWWGTNQTAQLLWPLVAMVPGDITECPSLMWPWVATGRLCHNILCYFGSLTRGPTMMKLFNMASLKFDEWGGTNMQSMEAANVL
jgi:hypothetical protein